MRIRLPVMLSVVLLLFLSVFLVGAAVAANMPGAANMPAAANTPAASVSVDDPIRLNEIMPRPEQGFDWIELYRPGQVSLMYLPLVRSGAGQAQVAAATVSHPGQVAGQDIRGWEVVAGQGARYVIPDQLPPVPAGASVLIIFDGLGPGQNDYSFSDFRAVLHTPPGMVNVLGDFVGSVGLYSGPQHGPATIRDFLAYGEFGGEAADDAVAAGLWPPDVFVGPTVQIPGGDALRTGGSMGLFPGDLTGAPEGWTLYAPGETSPGRSNPPPAPYFRNPPDGIVTTDSRIPFGWSNVAGAIAYQLQVDDDPGFGSPVIAMTIEGSIFVPPESLPAGVFHYRARAVFAGMKFSGWSAVGQVTFAGQGQAAAPGASRVLNVTPQLQHKDSRILCLDGHNETGQHRWDSAHEDDGDWTVGNGNAVRGEPHDDMYCTRAAISMIVDYFGGSLSQDRISYVHYGGGAPESDMGHGQGLWPCESGSWGSGDCVFGWALNGTAPTASRGKPTFAQARGWIDANRPILIVENGDSHSVVMDGYDTSGTQAHRVDPWTGSASWISWNSWSVTEYHVPPAAATVRSDEGTFAADTDGDGVTDWDELIRFHTDPTLADTDGDWVQDKQDIREYVFDAAGVYSPRASNFDGDGQRKELDPDNDGDGSVDGCEDTNYNGKYEAASGETNNFNAASHQACVPKFDILQPTQGNPVNAGAFNDPDKILVQVQTATPPSAPAIYTPGDFEVKIGGQTSTVVAVYQVLDTHMLVVDPHTQPAADYYDLKVTLAGVGNDTETRAVFYLPKLKTDQVLVIDRSGSMSDYGKMDAAKNAARAFVDHANVDDMIGVVSFASTAGPAPDYPLTKITGATEWNAAKAAINGLAAGGATALGSGAKLGYDEIVAKGRNDHDWAMALLSDGMENVAPNWADPTVSGVIAPSRVVVHTVALGYDADTLLLGAIAAQTGGTPYAAGVDLLPLAASAGMAPGAGITPSALPGPNLPPTLPNRLADVYKAIGEEIGHQQRLWERVGVVNGREVFELPVENGLPEAIFAVNWDEPGAPIEMILTDPKGDQVKAGYPGMRHQVDITHDQYRIAEPMPGVWTVDLRTREKGSHYLFILSARSQTTMHLGFGLPPVERRLGSAIPILAVLADRKPIAGAEVWALVQGPNSDLVELLQLFDDGRHGDGRADDGVYGNFFERTLKAGQYMVKATGWGRDNDGQPFVRHRNAGFQILPRVAYVWRNDLTTAQAYRELLEHAGFTVDLLHVSMVAKAPWARYSMAVVGPETGNGDEWGGDRDAINMLLEYGIPVIGLGEGGYAFFGKVGGLDIGYPQGWHGAETRTLAMDPAHQVWHSPNNIPLPRSRVAELYKRTAHIGIRFTKPPASVQLIGREPDDQEHFNIVQQAQRFLLWGFQAGPVWMTKEGQALFINVARYMVGM